MSDKNVLSLIYYGGDADDHRLDLYDASHSIEGLSRTLAILGHYYLTQRTIYKAPNSEMRLYLVPPEEGSFKQSVIVAVASTLIAVPFTVFATRVMESWVPPSSDPALIRVVELLEEQNRMLRKQLGLPNEVTEKEAKQEELTQKFIKENEKDLLTIRSVTSQSFKKTFRPIETGSAKQVGLIGGLGDKPKIVVDPDILGRIEADEVDKKDVMVMGVVNAFSRGSKTGSVFSRDYMANIRVEYAIDGRLARGDDFSWSQLSGKPIRMYGRFVRYFDGKVKKMLVYNVERVEEQIDIDDYFDNEREVREF